MVARQKKFSEGADNIYLYVLRIRQQKYFGLGLGKYHNDVLRVNNIKYYRRLHSFCNLIK